jgi:hypothetical protein
MTDFPASLIGYVPSHSNHPQTTTLAIELAGLSLSNRLFSSASLAPILPTTASVHAKVCQHPVVSATRMSKSYLCQ